MRRVLIVAVLIALRVVAQSAPKVAVVPSTGGGRAVSVVADGSRAIDVVVAATAAHAAALKCDGSALDLLTKTVVRMDRARIGLEELAYVIGVVADVHFEFVGDGLVATGVPAGDDGAALRSRTAIGYTEFARTAFPDAAYSAELSAARGRLAFELKDFETAYDSFQGIRPTELDPVSVQEFRMWAVEAAFRSGRSDDALAGVQSLERAAVDLPAIPGAELLAARLLISRGDLPGAAVRLRRAVAEGRFRRDRVLAILLLAEIAWRQRDGHAMLAVLARFGEGDRRAYPDLDRRTSFATALALSLLKRHDAAVVHFRLALRDDPDPERRARAARAAAEELRTAGRSFEALLAARQARAIAPIGRATVRAAILETEILAELGLAERALATAAEALAAIPEPGPDSDRLLELAATAAVESGRPEAADAALDAIQRRPGLGARAKRLSADLMRRTGRPADALRVLDALTPEETVAAGFDPVALARLKSTLAFAAGDAMRAAREIESLPPEAEKKP